MKSPNGYGAVTRLKGNRRHPFVVRKTVGWDGDKRVIKAVGYYATREEAMLALVEYNKSPYDIDARKITMSELYERWLSRESGAGRLAPTTVRCYRSAYNKWCVPLHGMVYRDIRAHMMQDCIDRSPVGGIVRGLFTSLDRYAAELDVIDKGCSRSTYAAAPEQAKIKTIFADIEVARLWENIKMPWVDTILILLYSGWRVSELLGLRIADIDVANRTMRGGIKTKAGKGRLVPIHSAILDIVLRRSKIGTSYLVELKRGKKSEYQAYRRKFMGVMGALEMSHTVHETRHTFRSWLGRTSASVPLINKIMGHTCGDVGLAVYTHTVIEELRGAVEMIKCERRPKLVAVSSA